MLAGIGLGGALALTRLMEGLLFEVSPTDGPSFAAIAALLIAVSFAASYLPARRAMSVDPSDSLRHE